MFLDSISINQDFSVIEGGRSHLDQDFAVLQGRNWLCGQYSIMAQWNPVRRRLLQHDGTRLLWQTRLVWHRDRHELIKLADLVNLIDQCIRAQISLSHLRRTFLQII